ncbi:MAG: DNA-directed DNA polymerase [Isosphaeraceae bacterium]|nr:MAG: DNA-directed DNA polymerase [Isosphaeraceae bacterium]
MAGSSRPFVHLHCHTHYSLLDGASKIPQLVAKVRAAGMPALAITDHGNLYGAMEFLREAKAAGIKPIVGIEAYVAPGHRWDRSGGGRSGQEYAFHLTLLARTGEGFRNLMRLSSKAFLEGFYYRPRIDKQILENHAEGLICLSGCAASEFSDLLLRGQRTKAEELAAWFARVFGPENFYIEIQNNGVAIQRQCQELAVDLARRMGMPLVATSDAHYLNREDASPHDILLCISTGKTIDDPNRLRFENDQFHVRTADEMYEAFPGYEEALAASAGIADRVEDNYSSLELGKRLFPSFQTPEGVTAEDYLRTLCLTGLRERYGERPPAEALPRLEHELAVINRMGFASYFLIVWDFVRFAREHGIPSSARGSACGALVSYLLYLSHVDPLQYDLLFERFLDPNRNEAPDIDIDLCKQGRYQVIEYVRSKYGEANVAQIGTFGTLGAKAALKDVGRALNIPLARVDQVTRLIPQRLNITLDEALQEEPQLRRLVADDPEIQRLMDLARALEGTVRNVSTHAAGVVIADRPLDSLVPLQKFPNKDKDKEVVSTQWEMGDVERAGLLKMDFLGLRNLTSLAAAERLVAKSTGKPLDLAAIPLDDPATFELLQRGDAKGVFQLDGAGIRDLLVKMKPDRFQDLIALLALYRPGPLNGGMVDAYVNRKHGREQPIYEHTVMREVLEETYGVMVYQEQVMRILNRLGGIELSQAYATIKAISKKKADVIAQGRKQFIEGAVERGLEREKATRIFDLIEFFGGYGFNKSHATAYALLAYQTAFLKAHYPTEFMAALLSSEMDGAEREKYFVEHVEDCRRMGIELLPPDVNSSELEFIPEGPNRIRFGLGAIKGVGLKAVEELLRARSAGGPFRSLLDFTDRVSARHCSQACIETLIKAGAFDSLGARRNQLLAILPRVVQEGQTRQGDRRRGQLSLFDTPETFDSGGHDMALPDLPPQPEAERLADEKKALGFYMSAHPLTRHASLLAAFSTHRIADLAELPERVEVTVGGMVGGLTIRNVSKSRSGLTRMAKFSFEDLTGSVAAMLWPEEFAKFESELCDDAIVFLRGTMNRVREPAELVVTKVIPLERAAAELTRGVVVTLRKGVHEFAQLERLQRAVRSHPGNLDLYLEVTGLPGYRRALIRVGAALRIRHDDQLLPDLEAVVGQGNVRLLGSRGSTARLDLVAARSSSPVAPPSDDELLPDPED